MNKAKSLLLLVLIVVCGVMFYGNFFVDDAYITLRYARNVIDGYGLRFNPADTQPLEGYTNFGWICIELPILLLTTCPEIIFGILSAFTIILTFLLLNRLKFSGWYLSPAVFIMLSFHSFWFWNTSGLETGMMGALILLWNVLFYIKYIRGNDNPDSLAASFTCPFAAFFTLLTRPDCIIVLFWQWFYLLIQKKKSHLGSYFLRLSALAIPYAVFKLSYFGKLLPNTFYAKTAFNASVLHRGWLYVISLPGTPEITILIIGMIAAIYMVISDRKNPADPENQPDKPGDWQITRGHLPSLWLFTGATLLSYLLYILKVGGDYLPFYRFLYPLLPWLVYLCSHSLTRISLTKQQLVVVSFTILFFMTTSFSCFSQALAFWTDQKVLVTAAKHLRKLHKPGTSTVTLASGIINYYCNFNGVDFYGLTNPEILRKSAQKQTREVTSIAGHDNYDIDFVKNLKPELIIPHRWLPVENNQVVIKSYYKPDNSGKYYFTGLKDIVEAPFLSRDYTEKRFRIQTNELDFIYIYYARKPTPYVP